MKLEDIEKILGNYRPVTDKPEIEAVMMKATKILLAQEFVKHASSPHEALFHIYRLLVQAEGMKEIFIASMASSPQAQLEARLFLEDGQKLGKRAAAELNKNIEEKDRG